MKIATPHVNSSTVAHDFVDTGSMTKSTKPSVSSWERPRKQTPGFMNSGDQRVPWARFGRLRRPNLAQPRWSGGEGEPVQIDEVLVGAAHEFQVDGMPAGGAGDVCRHCPPRLPAPGVRDGEATDRGT